MTKYGMFSQLYGWQKEKTIRQFAKQKSCFSLLYSIVWLQFKFGIVYLS